MATAGGGNSDPLSIEQHMFEEGYAYGFFQAVRLLERMAPERRAVGRTAPPQSESVRFKALPSLSFPPSAIHELQRPTAELPVPAMTVTFMGLTGPNGALPRHYTELLLKLQRDAKGPEKLALRAWFDLFNNRLIALFYRAWEKYRFYIGYERDTRAHGKGLDPFTRALFSFIGLDETPLRGRLSIVRVEPDRDEEAVDQLAAIEDLALLHYSGFLSHRPRCAISLEAMIRDYFQCPVRVVQFHGQWLLLDATNQSRAGMAHHQLGVSVVIGERVWDIQSKIRIRIGPIRYSVFNEFLPDRQPIEQRKAFFLLSHLVRLYVGKEMDFDIQLVLKAEDVPACRFTHEGTGPRLGWNTWVISEPLNHDAADAVFEGDEVVCL